MKRIHALLIALAVSFAVAAGTFAAIRTTRLGSASSPGISPVEFARQTRTLDRAQAKLEHALHQRPPKLPAVPATPAVTTLARHASTAPAPATPAATTPKVITIVEQPRTPATTTRTSPTTTREHADEHERTKQLESRESEPPDGSTKDD
jgi:hypothetical protein